MPGFVNDEAVEGKGKAKANDEALAGGGGGDGVDLAASQRPALSCSGAKIIKIPTRSTALATEQGSLSVTARKAPRGQSTVDCRGVVDVAPKEGRAYFSNSLLLHAISTLPYGSPGDAAGQQPLRSRHTHTHTHQWPSPAGPGPAG